MRTPKIQTALGKEFSPQGPISFSEFKEWLLAAPQFSHVAVYHKPPSKKTTLIRYLDLRSNYDHVISTEEIALILEAYNELRTEGRITDKNNINFKKFIVRDGKLTKKQFQDLAKLGVSRFENVVIKDESKKPFHFQSLALSCDKRAYVVDGILEIPDDTVLTKTEWDLLQNNPISFSFDVNVIMAYSQQAPTPGTIKNHTFECTYKTQTPTHFHNFTIIDDVDLSTIQKTKCSGFNIETATFTGSVNLCNAVFEKCETKGAQFKGGIIFNDNTDFTKWSAPVNMPNNAPIIYVNNKNNKSEEIQTTVGELYDALKEEYYKLRNERYKKFFVISRGRDYIKDELEAKLNTNGEKLFKLLQHMQEQKKNWFFHRTLDAFKNVMKPDGVVYQKHQARLIEQRVSKQVEMEQQNLRENTKQNEFDVLVEKIKQQELVAPNEIQSMEDAQRIRVSPPPPPLSKNAPPPSTVPQEKYDDDTLADYIGRHLYDAALKYLQQHKPPKLGDTVENAICKLRDDVYTEVFLNGNTGTSFQHLKLFSKSQFAKNPLIAGFLKKIKLDNFIKSAQLNIELTKCLNSLTSGHGENDFSQLAKLAYLAHTASLNNFNPLYWMDRASCDNFKKQRKAPLLTSLANIFPDGKEGAFDRLIKTKAIPDYIFTALGIKEHITEITNAANKILGHKEFSWARDAKGELDKEEINKAKPSFFSFFSFFMTRKKIIDAMHAFNLQNRIKALTTWCNPAENIKLLREKLVVTEFKSKELNNVISEIKKLIDKIDTLTTNSQCKSNLKLFSDAFDDIKRAEDEKAKAKAKKEEEQRTRSTSAFFHQPSQATLTGSSASTPTDTTPKSSNPQFKK